ncbi:MAG: bifunctional 4-hydroxy-2-oxoglutarate aldolase/2-dehydro-3-deoxy-phosphogluconate aldolase [Rhodothermales bacterium]|nr:bifunctional 4-hydroxy-2-oxoglutarate aldolase/2-dehydro-3-deoxy-phosphogluconate aldolase [Rhodothermales bacterium]
MDSRRSEIRQRLLDSGAIAVVRVTDTSVLLNVVEALIASGLVAIEITMTVPGAIKQIRKLSETFADDALLGVGSVTDESTAAQAVDAGATYVVSPVLIDSVVMRTLELDAVAIPGTFTPTEAQQAYSLGADFIKVFPADIVGMSYFKSVLAPLPHLPLIPTGGVTPDNAGDWIRAGAKCVGVGSALLKKSLIESGDFDGIGRLAKTLLQNVQSARS